MEEDEETKEQESILESDEKERKNLPLKRRNIEKKPKLSEKRRKNEGSSENNIFSDMLNVDLSSLDSIPSTTDNATTNTASDS